MSHYLYDLEKCALCGIDGATGRIEDLYFEDEDWNAKYLVVNVSGKFMHKRVLVPSSAICISNPETSSLFVPMTRHRIVRFPNAKTDLPVSRQRKIVGRLRYGIEIYLAGEAILTDPEFITDSIKVPLNSNGREFDPHLHSMADVTGLRVLLPDGIVGLVEDCIVDNSWNIMYLIVHLYDRVPQRTIILPALWMNRIDYETSVITSDISSREIEECPDCISVSHLSKSV